MSRPVPLPVLVESAPAGRVACTDCGRCCTYLGVGINAPITVRYATDVLWYLYHENVSVHRDADGEWSVVFETRCRHLQGDLLCGIYSRRPQVCRDFDDASCEVNSPGTGRTFTEPAEFLDWLKQDRPRVHRLVMRDYAPSRPGGGA